MDTQHEERKFNVAGTSMFERQRKLRFASGKPRTRSKILKRHGHREIQLLELPKPMTKEEATAWLLKEVGIKQNDEGEVDLKQLAEGLKPILKSLPPEPAPKRGRPVKEAA